jgi:tripartite-type tricarboxylate transporter receptor subunit TctC
VSNPALPARNFAEYVELARKKPESVSFGIVSAAGKLVVAMIDSATGAKLLQVPFGGTALSYTAMFGGHIDSIIDAPASSRAFIQAGKARALAVTSPQRSQLLPDVPTVSETLPGFEFVTWFGLFAPASTPMDRVENLSRSLRKALDTPKMREALAAADLIPAGNSSQDFASNIRAEFERNRQIVQRYAITN